MRVLVVGAGLTGATIARTLRDAGHHVEVIDRRRHVAGNVHDSDVDGVRVHTYGPHYFRTNNDRLWAWVNRFADWWPYEPCLKTTVDGELWPWPPTADVVAAYDGPLYEGPVTDFETACLAAMPEPLYRKFVEPYTANQWGVHPATLSVELAGRFDVRTDDLRLKPHKHQGIPVDGYTSLVTNMLEGIPCHLGQGWDGERWEHTVYTGPLDALYGHDMGRLQYRSQRRVHIRSHHRVLPCGQVNNPAGPHIRTIDWAHIDPRQPANTVLTTETPFTPREGDELEYPFPDAENAALAAAYKARAAQDPTLTVCGRLGDYRYWDMDQAIGRALRIADRINRGGGGTWLPPHGGGAGPTARSEHRSSEKKTAAASAATQ